MSNSDKLKILQNSLASIFDDYGMDISLGIWASEKDRWEELLVCIINQINSEPNIEEIREAIDILGKMNLTSPNLLSDLKTESIEYNFIFFLLRKFDFTEDEAIQTLNAIISISRIVAEKFDGKIQRYIRGYFEVMRNDMTKDFKNIGLSPKQIHLAVTHWLQNSTNAPLSLQHKAVENFYIEYETNESEFIKAVDELDINLAVMDDLLEKRQCIKNLDFDLGKTEIIAHESQS